MSEIGLLYIIILVDWSLSGIMTSKRVIRESESPRPAASSIMISRMTRSSVIIPYVMLDCDWHINASRWIKQNIFGPPITNPFLRSCGWIAYDSLFLSLREMHYWINITKFLCDLSGSGNAKSDWI